MHPLADCHQSCVYFCADGHADSVCPAQANAILLITDLPRWLHPVHVLSCSGNEIGALLAHWLWSNHKKAHPKQDPGRCVLLASAVSSRFLAVRGPQSSAYPWCIS